MDGSGLSPVLNIRNHKWSLINSLICYFCLIVIICVINKRCSFMKHEIINEPVSGYDDYTHISLKVENGKIILFINETTNDLKFIKWFVNSGEVFYYDLFDAFEFLKAFKHCGSGLNCAHFKKIRANTSSSCAYYVHVHLLEFCYSKLGHLMFIKWHDEVELSTNDVKRFAAVLDILLKV